MKTIFIGIVGPSGSGKTTLCKKLKLSNKNHEHIRLDNYFKNPQTFPLKNGFRNWEKPSNLKFDVLLKHLKALQNGKEVHTKSFPKRAGAKPTPITLKPKPIILIEGFMLFKDKRVRDMLDVKIYLEIHPELMLKRRAIRFGEAHITDYDTKVAIPEFLKHGTTQKKYADYVVDATRSQPQVIKEVQKIINQNLTNF
ncbi:MAG: AAA family ATPase [Candidatus Yanofskybacteria bacterium]|nr:AAA family ATPase [Candidatus Yanofskybacteria bacterium]